MLDIHRSMASIAGRQYSKKWCLSTFLVALFMGLWVTSMGQSYDFKRYREESGLADRYVYSIVQDNRGFLYLGTGAGLFRFDGAKFHLFGTKQGLAEEFTTASFKDSHGLIWLGHYEGRLSLLIDMQVRPLQDSNVIKSLVCGFAEDDRGNIWCAAQSGLFLLDTTGVVEKFTAGLDGRRVHSLSIGKIGGIQYCLLGTDQGLLVYQVAGKKAKFLYASTIVPETKLQCIVKQPGNTGFLIGTEDEGLIEFQPALRDSSASVVAYNATTGFPYLSNVQCLLIDKDKTLWAGTASQGFYKFDATAAGIFSPTTPLLPSDSIGEENLRTIYQDQFGQVWMGSYGNGLLCFSEDKFSAFKILNDSTSKMEMLCAIEDRLGDLWVGTTNGIYVLDRSMVSTDGGRYSFSGKLGLRAKQHYTIANGLPSNEVSSLLQDDRQNIWAGTRADGIAFLTAGEASFVKKSLSELSLSNHINDIIQDHEGKIWIATTDGVFSYDQDTDATQFFGTQNKLPHNNIYGIFCDKSGNLWFATHTNLIAIYDGKTFRNLEVTAHGEVPSITCINQTKDGTIWMGTDGSGLYRYDGDKSFRQFTKLDGLQSNYVYHIVIDHYNNVWTTHRDGFTRLINDTGRLIAYPAKAYFPKDENPVSGASIDAFGNIWFSTEYGLVRYNWSPALNKTAPPFIFIHSVEIGDSSWDTKAEIQLANGDYTIRFGFLGLTFLNQEDVLYQYKLEGREQDWSAPTKQDFVTYQGLADGEYTFHVRACNGIGKCNESSARITFVIAPPFWKSWWFKVFVGLVLIGLIYSYFRFRLYRLNREKSALEEKVKQRTVELRQEKDKVEQANMELEKLSLVASETDNAVFILDAKGDLTWVNAGFTRLTGFTMDELLQIRGGHEDFLSTSSNAWVKERLQQSILKNSSVQYESQLPSKSGESIWVISTLTPILDKQGNLRNIIIIDSNITDRKIAEEKINQMNAELESQVAARTRELAEANESLQLENAEHIKTAEQLKVINSELDTFVYRASHDLKGPLASLMGLINIAGMELTDNQVATRYLGLMDKASKRLDGILIDLIEATQVKQRTVDLVDFDALTLAQSVSQVVEQQTDMTNAEIILDISPDLTLHTDEQLLTAILQNFLGNALKYRDKSKEKATAKLSIHREGEFCNITVTDNGIGIPEEMKHRVFDMFFRGTHQTGGSGLGLYIVKQAAEKLGGRVSLTSKLGDGTTMHAKIPM